MKCYQMLPVGGTREFKIRLSGKIQLVVEKTRLIELGTAQATAATQILFDSNSLQEFSFSIKSIAGAGRTQIVAARTSDGRVLDRLIVSVKSERLLTYNVHRLQDIARVTRRSFGELQTIMSKVEKYYLNQANIKLIRKRTQTLFIRSDLGDPMDPSTDKMKPFDEELTKGGFYAADLNVISTWDLNDPVLLGKLEGMTPFALQRFRPQFTLNRVNSDDQETNTYAHEIGHALGLDHSDQPDNFLMNGAGNLGYAIRSVDIDRLNTSGNTP